MDASDRHNGQRDKRTDGRRDASLRPSVRLSLKTEFDTPCAYAFDINVSVGPGLYPWSEHNRGNL